MIRYWQQLNERERWAVILAGAVLGCYLFYLLIYSPLTTAAKFQLQQFSEKSETLAWMTRVQQQVKQRPRKQNITQAQLLSRMTSDFKKSDFQAFSYQLQQTSSGDIQLHFDKVPYSTLMLWLWNLTKNYQILLKQVSIEKTPASGLVTVNLILTLG